MAQYSPELIEQTIMILESQNGGVTSQEDARQAVENISGFFQLLQDWDEADKESWESSSYTPKKGGGAPRWTHLLPHH